MNRQPKLKKRPGLAVMIIILAFILLTGGGLLAAGILNDPINDIEAADNPENLNTFKGRLNVLVLGADTRKGEDVARADTIMLYSVDTEKSIMSVLSIPRDTMVKIPGHGLVKINSATVYGGPGLAMKVVSDLLGISVNNYVMLDYDGFKQAVNALGGVTIDVKEEMYHYDPEDNGIYNIEIMPGVQKLNGDKALQYVRYRSYELGDIERTQKQQEFLSALIKEALKPSTVIKLPTLIMSVYKAVDTNLSLPEMMELAETAGKMTDINLVTQTLPGKFLTMDGVSYWEPDPSHTLLVMSGILDGRASGVVVLGENTVEATDSTDGQKTKGKVVPGQPGLAGGTKTKAKISNTSVKDGPSGKAPAEGGTSAGENKKTGSRRNQRS